MSKRDIGIFERDLPNLKQVVVVANKIEKPDSAFSDAIEDNFGKKVKYLFLISDSNADTELKGYYLIFQALAQKVSEENDHPIPIDTLVEIKKLSYDWPDVPYIFYQYEPDKSSGRLTIAFRGNQKGEGIADFYEKLAPSHSKAIVTALLSEAPEEIRANLKLVSPEVTRTNLRLVSNE